MLVVLDGLPVQPTSAPATLKSLIDDVARGRVGQRLVVSVSVNGVSLVGAELDHALAEPVAGEDEIFLASADPTELAREALTELAGQFERIGEELPILADGLKAGQVQEASRGMTPLLQTMQGLQAVIRQCSQVLEFDLSCCRHGERTVGMELETLATRLQELRDALLARDYALLGDMLRFDLPELCASWGTMLRATAEEAAGRALGGLKST